MTPSKPALRILRVLRDTGPRPANLLSGLAPSAAAFERAIGQLFLQGSVKWIGAKRGRRLAAKTRAARACR